MGNVKHAFTSAKADGGDASLVRPSNWNAAHTGAVEILDRDLTQIDVANDAAETSIYSFSVPAGALGTDGGFRLTLGGDSLRNAAGTLIIRIKLGATTVFTSDAFSSTNLADRYRWTLQVLCLNSAADAQKWNAWMNMIANVANLSVRVGANTQKVLLEGQASSGEDTAGALVLDITADFSVASASLSFRKEMALLELIPAA